MIVGHKTERYLTAQQRDYGGHWIVTHHQIITELHATKGWRRVSHERKNHTVKALPPVDQWRNANISVFKRAAFKGREPLMELSPDAMEKSRLRHAWYRKQKAREALRASLPAANVHPDYHTEAQRKEAANVG